MFELWDDVRLYLSEYRCPREAWERCEHAHWLVHWAQRAGVPRPILVLLACVCARLALRNVPTGELRHLQAIAAAEAWIHGDLRIISDAAEVSAMTAEVYSDDAATAIRHAVAWPIMAYALEQHGVPLGESWLETVAHACGAGDVRIPHDTEGADLAHRIKHVSREMARAGRWDASVLAPYWERARLIAEPEVA